MAQFITTSELKAYTLPVTAAQWSKVGDDQLDIVIETASDHIEDYLDRKVLSTNYTDRRAGSGTHKILLSAYPVTAVSSAYQIDSVGTVLSWDPSVFHINEQAGILEFINRARYGFYKHYTWQFDYTAGFATVPSPIKHATALQTVKMLQPIFRGGAQFTETELIADLDEQVMELIDVYKRKRIS